MSASDPILLTLDGAIATVTFNRPERRNAITFAMWNHLQRLLVDLKENPAVRVIVFRGAGGEAFFCRRGHQRVRHPSQQRCQGHAVQRCL